MTRTVIQAGAVGKVTQARHATDYKTLITRVPQLRCALPAGVAVGYRPLVTSPGRRRRVTGALASGRHKINRNFE
ncbi:unnamed protein product [Protopolystoma xenopodis]|uniref:Uncharacterized protein n=1 Tax=Protopolystoma xenopodis TaxID=117903 RepID=A0A3S5CSX6_9PLAT|nr:unnamed protein product [Protopolystoma xenopodis]